MSTRSTAQVPVPDELNLDLAFDGESLDRLLEVEVCTVHTPVALQNLLSELLDYGLCM